MAVEWTPEQKKAIETHGGNILVAAAAGSGKTAVLVERIIRMITDTENPVSVDKLLVLTYTDAAASEMKRKIAAAIDMKLEEDPNNGYLREQSIKVGSASISTIHSFCNRIIANNVHLTDLPPVFSLIDEVENKILQSNAVDAVLESYYSRIDRKQGFRELVTGWGGVKGDSYLRDTIIKMHNFSRSLAYPKRWLHDAYTKGYADVEKYGVVEGSVWDKLLKKTIYTLAQGVAEGMGVLFGFVDRDIPADHPLYTYYYEMKAEFCNIFDSIEIDEKDGMEKLSRLIRSFEIKKAPPARGIDPAVAKKISTFRDKKVKAKLKEATEMMNATSGDAAERMIKCLPMVRTLVSIVRQVERVHQRYKKEKSVIDFNDLEHGLLGLLCGEHGAETSLCRELREYYHEILVDEFQDTNALQYEIFRRISKEAGNLFMVGDVKQSIYKFRNADPSIFLRLYKSYGNGEGGQLIRLFKNFRSRKEVTDSVNFVFSSVMSERVGGIEYTEEEYLVNGASFPEGEGYITEILVTDTEAEPAQEDIDKDELEARNVARRIYDMVKVESLKVTDKDTKKKRDIKYGDIAVLCRGRAGCVCIEKALLDIGIPSVSDAGRHYLDSVEVLTVLNFLQIIDNPIQDIPLVAVMRSAMFDFSAEELARIRKCADGRYYYALEAAAADNKKAAEFLEVLNNLRECAKYMGVDELVWKICFELHYFSIVGAMKGGEQCKANLKLLLARCQDFEQGSLTGLFNFIKYIEALREREEDLAPATEVAADGEAVRIMTMHRSKGLEFPVVFVSGTSKKFNLSDAYRNIIWDAYFGIGLDYIDTKKRVKYSMPFKRMIEAEMMSAQKAEEMRLLYVAMTRAKEKLIVSATVSARDNKWKESEFDDEDRIYPAFVDDMVRMRDWVLGSALKHPSARNLREFADRLDIVASARTKGDIKVVFAYNMEATTEDTDESVARETESKAEHTDAREMLERISYSYPYAKLAQIPAKMSVSELKRRRMPEDDFSTGLLRTSKTLLSDTSEINSAERGTITHYVMQRLDLGAVETERQIGEQIDKMVENGTISVRQKEVVDVAAIAGFFACDLGQRLRSSKRVEREYDFYMLIPPKEIAEGLDFEGAEDVILQGIADCFFYEDDGIVLIDYKTDRVGKTTVKERSEFYRLQIEYYSRGIESIFGLKVKERYLYFLNCGEAVRM